MFELAPQLKAMVVFAEHRFYGERFFEWSENNTFLNSILLLVFLLEFKTLSTLPTLVCFPLNKPLLIFQPLVFG